MTNRVIDFSAKQRAIVLGVWVVVAIVGWWSMVDRASGALRDLGSQRYAGQSERAMTSDEASERFNQEGDIAMKHLTPNAVRSALVASSLLAWVAPAVPAQTAARGTRPQASHATSVEKRVLPAPDSAVISGVVLAAATSKPIKGARVMVKTPELPGGRSVLSDDSGFYKIDGLRAGRYTIVASKPGFLDLVYGQRRPLMDGEVVELDKGEAYPNTDCKLLRAGAIAGRILDENGEPLTDATVRVMKYWSRQGVRPLESAGTARVDDKGNFRVWGLMPGEYSVSATAPGSSHPAVQWHTGSDGQVKVITLGISQELLSIDINFDRGSAAAGR